MNDRRTSHPMKAGEKKRQQMIVPCWRLAPIALGLIALVAAPAWSLPVDPGIVSGSVTVTQPQADALLVNQYSQSAQIDWRSFDIAHGERVQFVQPDANSVIFNKVLSSDPSIIFGTISANGRVFLINPAGIIFGPSAVVDTGSLVASALDVRHDPANRDRFSLVATTDQPGRIENQGLLSAAPGGVVALIGGQVVNGGSILTPAGTAALVAAARLTLDFAGDKLLSFEVDPALARASIRHGGRIEADGGNVVFEVRARDALLDTVLNVDGVVKANRLVDRNGTIHIDGGDSGIVRIGGQLDASGIRAAGGLVEVTGDKVWLDEGARLLASGATGGGSIHVGGDWQGRGPLHTASMTHVAAGARLEADAIESGNGGEVVVWSNENTRFFGHAQAQGGLLGGDGGRGEVSSKDYLDFGGTFSAAAPQGKVGMLLLDPLDITISDAQTSSNVSESPTLFAPAESPSVLGWGALGKALSEAEVTVTTAASTGTQLGNIAVITEAAALPDLASRHSLTLETADNGKIDISAAITNTGGGSLSLNAGTGGVTFDAGVTLSGGVSGLTVVSKGSIDAPSSAIDVAGQSSFKTTATDATISLSELAATGPVSLNTVDSKGSVTVVSTKALDLAASNVGGNLTLGAGGHITQSGALTVAGTTSLSASNPLTNVDLSTQANDLKGAVIIAGTQSNVQDFALRNTNAGAGAIVNLDSERTKNLRDLKIIYDNAAYEIPSFTTGTLRNIGITAGGAITQASGGVQNLGTASFTTSGAFDITLAETNNSFGSRVALNIGGSGNATVVDATALDLAASKVGGNLTLGAGGHITQSGALRVAGTTSLSASNPLTNVDLSTQANDLKGAVIIAGTQSNVQDFALRNTNAGAGAVVNLDSERMKNLRDLKIIYDNAAYVLPSFTTGTLRNIGITAGGAITQASGGVQNLGTASFTTSGAFDITLADAANHFGTSVALNTGGSGNATVVDANALDLAASKVGGNLTIGAGGHITQSGALRVAGTTSLSASNPLTNVDLSTQANDLKGAVIIAGTQSNVQDFALRNTNAGAGAVVNLDSERTKNLRDLNIIYDNAAYVLPSFTTGTLRNIGITAGGAITQASGGVHSTGSASFTTSGAFDITLADAANHFGTSVALNTGVGGNATVLNAQLLDLTTSNVGGGLTATVTAGGISQSGGGLSIGGEAAFTATGQAITLNNASNNFGRTVTLTGEATELRAGNDVTVVLATTATTKLQAGGKLTVSGAVGGSASDLTTTTTGSGATSFGETSVGRNLNVVSAGSVSQTGPLSVMGKTDIYANGQEVALSNTANDFIGEAKVTGGKVSLNDANSLSAAVQAGGDVSLTAQDTLSTADPVSGANLTLTGVKGVSLGHAVDASGYLLVKGVTTINTSWVSSSGAQTYSNAVLLGVDTTLSGKNVSLGSTVDGAYALTVNDGGTTTFGGAVGANVPLTRLSTDNKGTTAIHGGAVTTSAAQTYGDALVLGAETTLTGTNVTLASTLDGAYALTVNDGGTTTFGGVVGGTKSLVSLSTIAGGTTAIHANVTTTGAQSYGEDVFIDTAHATLATSGGAVRIAGSTTLNKGLTVSSGIGDVTFSGTVDGGDALVVNSAGISTFSKAVGENIKLASLTTDMGGVTAIDGGAVTTTGAQNYGNAVVLGADTTLGGTNVSLASTVDGAHALTVNDGGTTTIGGVVGGKTALTMLSTDDKGTTAINGGAVTTSGAQTYGDAVVLGADTTLTGTNLSLGATVDGAHALTLDDDGKTTFGGAVGGKTALTMLRTDDKGVTAINGGSVTTMGAQTYGDAVVLGADTRLTGTNLSLGSTLDGTYALTVNDGGTTTFGGVIGGKAALTLLNTDPSGTTAINGGAVTTSAAQTYGDAVVLGADTTLTGTNVSLGSTLDGAHALTVSDGGTTRFGGAVGGRTALTMLSTDQPGTTVIDGGAVTTSAAQGYGDAVVLGADTTLTGTNVSLGSTLDGAHALTISDGETTRFGGAVGGRTALTTLSTDQPGTTVIDGGAVTTSAAQSYGDAVVLGADTTLTGTNVSLGSTLDGAHALTANDGGTTRFGGAVGGRTALTTLSTDPSGTTVIDGGAVTTSAAQSYGDAVVLGADTTLTGTNVSLGSTLDGAHALTVNDDGRTTFAGLVGAMKALTTLSTDRSGTTAITAGAVTTSSAQTYGDDLVFGEADTTTLTISSGTGNVTFNGKVDGVGSLALNSQGDVTFNDAVGADKPLTSLSTDAGGKLVINGGLVRTTGKQSYGDLVEVKGNTMLHVSGSDAQTLLFTGEHGFSFAYYDNAVELGEGGSIRNGADSRLTVVVDGPGSVDLLGLQPKDPNSRAPSLAELIGTAAETFATASRAPEGLAGWTTRNDLQGEVSVITSVPGQDRSLETKYLVGIASPTIRIAKFGGSDTRADIGIDADSVLLMTSALPISRKDGVVENGIIKATASVAADVAALSPDLPALTVLPVEQQGQGASQPYYYGSAQRDSWIPVELGIDAQHRGLVVFLPSRNAGGKAPWLYLGGPVELRPVQSSSSLVRYGDSSALVIYNGEIIPTAQFAGFEAALGQLLNDVRREQLERGYANESIPARLRTGVVMETGLGSPAVDEFEGAALPARCTGRVSASGMSCAN